MINMIKPKFFSKPTKFKLSYLSLILLNSWFSYAYANEYVEFDADFLFGSESKKILMFNALVMRTQFQQVNILQMFI